eukprot:1589351-Lingulodinium_polyedra.AAC.1
MAGAALRLLAVDSRAGNRANLHLLDARAGVVWVSRLRFGYQPELGFRVSPSRTPRRAATSRRGELWAGR